MKLIQKNRVAMGALLATVLGVAGCATDYTPPEHSSTTEMRPLQEVTTEVQTLIPSTYSSNIKGVVVDNSIMAVTRADGKVDEFAIYRLSPSSTGFWLWDIFLPIGECYIHPIKGEAFDFNRSPAFGCGADDEKIVNSLIELRDLTQQAVDQRFAQALAYYSNASPKPGPTEQIRQYEVQAQSAVNAQKYALAGLIFLKGEDAVPWWPPFYYDYALVLAQLQRYQSAIDQMTRFLKLSPDAPNARQAQDKIYEWQSKIPLSANSPNQEP